MAAEYVQWFNDQYVWRVSHVLFELFLGESCGGSVELIISLVVSSLSCQSKCQLVFPFLESIFANLKLSDCVFILLDQVCVVLLGLVDVVENVANNIDVRDTKHEETNNTSDCCLVSPWVVICALDMEWLKRWLTSEDRFLLFSFLGVGGCQEHCYCWNNVSKFRHFYLRITIINIEFTVCI